MQLIQQGPKNTRTARPVSKNITTAYNLRLIFPNMNLQTYEDCMEHEEFGEFFSPYKDKWLGCTMAEAEEGMERFNSCFPLSP